MRYLDTSAAMKLLVEEPESAALAEMLDRTADEDRLVSSWLLHTELQCALVRRPEVFDPASIEAVLSRVVLVDLARADLLRAPVAGAGLRSHDAIHLAVAVRIGADAMLTYDREQAAAAQAAGMRVQHPGAVPS